MSDLASLPFKQRISFIEEAFLQDLYHHDICTYWHSKRVAILLERFSAFLGYETKERETLYEIGLLHDIGKLDVSATILNKAGDLNPTEWTYICKHSIRSVSRMNDKASFSFQHQRAVLEHHENMNGSGYPYQLFGGEISSYARMLRIVDSFDAITSKRAYGNKISSSKAIRILKHDSYAYFDQSLTQAFTTFYHLDRGQRIRKSPYFRYPF